MGFYWLKDGMHSKMDGIIAKFLWQSAIDKFRYHMANFEMVCRPKDQGGLGVINTKIMNESLLVKWIWKIHLEPDSLWFRILKAKYMRNGVFLGLKSKDLLNFGKGFIKSNISLNGELFLRLKIESSAGFGKIVGSWRSL